MDNFSPSRLVLARKRRGITKKDLAAAIGISRRILIAYEQGEKQPSNLTLQKLADVLDFPAAFFLASELDEPQLDVASFRALSTLTARQRDQALGAGALAFWLNDWIDERFELPASDVPQVQALDPETAADVVRQEWSLGERPVSNMVHLLEAQGIRVFSLVEECAEVDAFSLWRRSTPYVFLNTMKSSEHSRLDAAHELGHLVMHWRHDTPRGREVEKEANAFASAFLMPRASVLAYPVGQSPTLSHLIKAKHRWKVSLAALVYRLHSLNLITEWQYRSLFIEMGKLGYRKDEPQSVSRETSQVLPKVLAALRKEGMGKSSIAEDLSLPVHELDKLLHGLVLMPLQGGGKGKDGSRSRERSLRLV